MFTSHFTFIFKYQRLYTQRSKLMWIHVTTGGAGGWVKNSIDVGKSNTPWNIRPAYQFSGNLVGFCSIFGNIPFRINESLKCAIFSSRKVAECKLNDSMIRMEKTSSLNIEDENSCRLVTFRSLLKPQRRNCRNTWSWVSFVQTSCLCKLRCEMSLLIASRLKQFLIWKSSMLLEKPNWTAAPYVVPQQIEAKNQWHFARDVYFESTHKMVILWLRWTTSHLYRKEHLKSEPLMIS